MGTNSRSNYKICLEVAHHEKQLMEAVGHDPHALTGVDLCVPEELYINSGAHYCHLVNMMGQLCKKMAELIEMPFVWAQGTMLVFPRMLLTSVQTGKPQTRDFPKDSLSDYNVACFQITLGKLVIITDTCKVQCR